MSVRKLMKLGVIATVSATMLLGCGGGGGGGGETPAPTSVTIEGKQVIDGYLEGATVYVECNGVRYYAPGPTDNEGKFGDFPVPYECRNENVRVEGGTDTVTGKEFRGVLLAKNGQNVTPLTTLVVLNPDLEAKLEELTDGRIDIDYVKEKTKPDVLEVAQTVAQVVSKAAEAAGITKPEDVEEVLKSVATELATVNDIADETQIVKAVTSAVATKVKEIAEASGTAKIGDVNTFQDALETIANGVVNAIPDDQPVDLQSIADYASNLETAVTTADTQLSTAVTRLEVVPTVVKFAGHEATVQDSKFTLLVPVTDVQNNKELGLTVEINNAEEIIGAGNEKTYEVSSTATVTDNSSKRKAVVSLEPVYVTINGSGEITSVEVPGTDSEKGPAKLTVSGTDSTGEAINPVVVENKQTDSNFNGIIGLNTSGNVSTISFDLEVVEDKIQSEVSEDHPLYMVDYKGNYDIEIRIEGLPVDTIKGTLTVN